jgi:hypothetical protein
MTQRNIKLSCCRKFSPPDRQIGGFDPNRLAGYDGCAAGSGALVFGVVNQTPLATAATLAKP